MMEQIRKQGLQENEKTKGNMEQTGSKWRKGSEREDADEGTRNNRKGRTGSGREGWKCTHVTFNGRTTRDGNGEHLHAKKQ